VADRQLAALLPDVKERANILGHYLKDKPVAPGLDTVRECARRLRGSRRRGGGGAVVSDDKEGSFTASGSVV
jgi:hypothetical protein